MSCRLAGIERADILFLLLPWSFNFSLDCCQCQEEKYYYRYSDFLGFFNTFLLLDIF